jgi:polyhydroxyalkanoate synthase
MMELTAELSALVAANLDSVREAVDGRSADIRTAAASLEMIAKAYAADPEALSRSQERFAASYHDMMMRLMAGDHDPDADADRRFASPEWRESPFHDFIRRAYLVSTAAAERMALEAPGVGDEDRRRAAFFVRQAAAALSPSNSFVTNPLALGAFIASNGQSIVKGLSQLESDMKRGGGRPTPSQSAPGALRIGADIAATPGEVIYANELIELIRYEPTRPSVHATPILITPPWINKFYVLDLTPANSMAAWLRDEGFTVHIISWRSAVPGADPLGWDDYMERGALAALNAVLPRGGKSGAHLVGYCLGGVLAACLCAWTGQRSPGRIRSLTLLAAQLDFSSPGDLGLFMGAAERARIEEIISGSGGIMPGEAMRDAFNALRPEDLIWSHVERQYLLGEPPGVFDLLHWNSDTTHIPGKLHLETIDRLYRDNALIKGAFPVLGETVSLNAMGCRVFVHAARKDHISPARSVYAGALATGDQTTFLLSDSGHIAGVVNPPSAGKYRYWTNPGLPPRLDDWLEGAVETPGSWWPAWRDWLVAGSGRRRRPPPAIAGSDPAPGRYVFTPNGVEAAAGATPG